MPKTVHVVIGAVVIFTTFVVWVVGGWTHGTSVKTINDIVFVVLSILGTVFAAFAVRAVHGRLRAAWIAMTVGMAGWALGEVLWAYYEIALDEPPFPSLADAAYLVMPVGFCVGLLLFPADSGQSRGRTLLDGVIVAGSLFVVSWVTILSPMYAAGSDSPAAMVISLAYPISDVVILTIAATAWLRAAKDQRRVLAMLTIAIACIALSDSGFTYLSAEDAYSSGNFIDIGWVAGLLLIMVAATASRDAVGLPPTQAALTGWAPVWFPYAPLLLAGIIAAAEPATIFQTPMVEAVGALLILAVLGRQYLAATENRRLLATVAEQALRDPLTGLANRAMFSDRLQEAMQRRERDHVCVALIILDLNDFKVVNDTLGHPAGDELLNRVGERILGCVRNSETVARLGGDEFVVLVDDDSADVYAGQIAARVAESFDKPFAIDGHELFIRPSVGLAVAGADEAGVSAEALVKRADMAMYAAKRTRTAGVHTFAPELGVSNPPDDGVSQRAPTTPSTADMAAVQLLGELRQAIDSVELTLLYQPKFNLLTGAMVGVEALVRWPHHRRGLLSPDEFLPLVRHHGLMRPVTDLVINTALDAVLQWHQEGLQLPVAVNMSAPLLADPHLPTRIRRALAERNLPASALTVEITEDLVLGNIEGTRDVLNQLRCSGIRIAIDDFGSGYSTLSYLCELPVDEVKLDRKLVLPILTDVRVATVVRAVIALAHELGLIVVAEGVEDATTAARLTEFGCDVVQGFYFSVPVSAAEVSGLAAKPTTPPLRLPMLHGQHQGPR
ncbi:diguanylate cyclase (GGDEF)-like protein [Mycolicibacterium sp. BK556]|uniref:putative bifunctional diguanylate cyclase/phosphodiesterase n=1 Tax=unclassified Mycolicibacterium TaxID=2636767 RepID=UPI00160FC3D1|nr:MULTISPECIES: EAL domain-containing protein [unclassified Mycolicibacterium]MBB3603808.1 diguanylate cyclase (GGDEF)-like protein [Mycolicibacterium sp. BK556]MBB3634003.1 diguanylate cyclase (GGDEF)-like protein [Mycolicibacterium sp. BK607]